MGKLNEPDKFNYVRINDVKVHRRNSYFIIPELVPIQVIRYERT